MNGKLTAAAVLIVLLLAPAAPAVALEWSLGADLGGSIFMPGYPDAAGTATFAWPMVGPGMYQVGGLRLGFAGENPAHEIWFGSSYSSSTSEGHTHGWFMMSGNYQYNFPAKGRVKPYATAGLGVSENLGTSAGGAGMLFGLGAGLARGVSDGAGRVRVEVRYDRQTEGLSHGYVIVPKGGAFGLKLGFDLWVR